MKNPKKWLNDLINVPNWLKNNLIFFFFYMYLQKLSKFKNLIG